MANDKELKTHLSIRINREEPMSQSGFNRWGHPIRNRLHRKVYRPKLIFCKKYNNLLPIKYLATDQALGELCCEHFDNGDQLIILGYSHGKTRTHIKQVKLARVKILDSENNKFEVSETQRLNRYWFRQNRKINKHQEKYSEVITE